jgi:hypothetical protein
MPSYYSAINVPTDTAGFVELINSDSYYYISPNGVDIVGNGSSSAPWATLSYAFDFIENKRIAKDNYVYFVIQSVSGATGWNQHLLSDTQITVRHPDADRVVIKGETPSTLTPYAINYYDSTLRGMGDGVTGGYLMELTVATATGVEVGDFIRISDDNYTTDGRFVAGVSGPTALETDFAHYSSGSTNGYDISGGTYDAPPLSLRKTLAFGCHEVVGVDYDAGAGVASQNILVHIRHYNPTSDLHYFVNGLTGASGAYVSPQGLRWNSTASFFPTHSSNTNTGTAGYVNGTDYGGITAHRLTTNFPTAAKNLIPDASGFTAGATGNFGGWVSGNDLTAYDYGIAVGAATGSNFGGVSGGNAEYWDLSPTTDAAGASGAFTGIKVQHIPSRINFNSGTGLYITGTKLAKIQDVVLCGPGFDLSANAGVPSSEISSGIKAEFGGGLAESQNVSVVGFGKGFEAKSDSFINADTSVVSGCGHGFACHSNGYVQANYTIASGCSTGYYALAEGHINAKGAIATANYENGFLAQQDSTVYAMYSVSCFNGGNGYLAEMNSHMGLHFPRGETTLHGSILEKYRYGASDKTGAIAFRNSGSGFKAYDSSSIFAPQSRASYNKESGYNIDKHSTLNSVYSNAWFNGFVTPGVSSGYQIMNSSSAIINNSNSMWNAKNGVEADLNSFASIKGSTADRNQHNAFVASYASVMRDSTATFGGTSSNGITGVPGPSNLEVPNVGCGFYAEADSTIFHSTGILNGGITHSNNSNIRAY